ncbi:tryptophan synthase beta subunit-like PLP-dependent enzyme [Paraphoma chrysanthemicola]|uniref:Tryptophan synthase beta subunit-like PLP-dependent enzyme n=1 Tax=Paraphoma chrysanthemicola TaxID=798071 RepID=A0A8K0VVY3_9PLEO|nr:tryptophan synthase beta subunit-like PLP-dependent enzyme [Paraphoma chrysanthemicola]
MSPRNPLNVYSGPDAVRNYFNPEIHPLLPLIEIPSTLNPFHGDGVRIYAKMMSMHPANNVKIMPAMNMLSKEVHPETSTVVEYSSGSTVISLALASRIYHGIDDVKAFLSNKTTTSKLRMMQFFGLDITLFGGPSQPEPLDERGGIQRARLLAQDDSRCLNANQYENDGNWLSHVRWTGPQILEQLPNINLMCAGMGTSGTMTGLGQFFKQAKPSVRRLGVCTAAGDRVPGPRSFALLAPVEFPWRDSVDAVEEVGSRDSFGISLQLCREGLICGPSSGFNLKGLLNYLEREKSAGTLPNLAGSDGLINCVFICCDLPYQYIDEYFEKVGGEAFHPIQNHNLAGVDLYRYDEAWELSAAEAIERYSKDDPATPCTVLIDLRKPDDFISSNVPGSYNLPLQSLNSSTSSPFFDAAVLERQWKELDAMLSHNTISAYDLAEKNVGVLCYEGDTARVATSVLRARGIAASSIKGGFQALTAQLPSLQRQGSRSFGEWAKTPSINDRDLEADAKSSDAALREVIVNAP